MTHSKWHISREDGVLTLSRRLPARFDVEVSTTLPAGSATRYAHQIRQDIWRALQNCRGFCPVVRLQATDKGWAVQAGGSLLGRSTAHMVQQISEVLSDPKRRARWVLHANRGRNSRD